MCLSRPWRRPMPKATPSNPPPPSLLVSVGMFLLFTALVTLSSATSAFAWHRIPALDSIERDIDCGRLQRAMLSLSRWEGRLSTPEAEGWRKVLLARLLHDRGEWRESVLLLRPLIDAWRHVPAMDEVLAEALLEYARACRSFLWLERMNAANDSVGMIASRRALPGHVRMRHHIMKALYLSMVMILEKVPPYLDSMRSLLAMAPPSERRLYQPSLALSVEISYLRSNDLARTAHICDSLLSLPPRADPTEGSFSGIALWRAAANHYLDRVTHGKKGGEDWRSSGAKSLKCFSRALILLKDRYPTNSAERLNLLNLHGLVLFQLRRFDEAMRDFTSAGTILSEPRHSIESHTYMHYQTALYSFRCIDSAFKGSELQARRKKRLEDWRRLSGVWERWEETNRDSLGHYRLHFTTDPGHVIVETAYALYLDTGDSSLLETMFQGQESAKYRNLKRRMLERAGIPEPRPPTLRSLQRGLAPDEALLSVSSATSILLSEYLILVTPDTVVVRAIDKAKMQFSAQRDGGIYATGDIHSYMAVFHPLYNLVFRDFEPFLTKTRRVSVIPSGETMLMPFDVLVPDSVGVRDFGSLRLLRDRYRFTYDYSLTVAEIRRRTESDPRPPSRPMAFVPDYRNGPYHRLRFFERQALSLREDFGFEVNPGGQASVSDFLRSASEAGVIHLAGHGFSYSWSPADNFIVMDSAGPGQSRLLTPHQLRNMGTDAELAVLAICMGGVGETYTDVRNTAYWFSHAGVHTVLYSPWKLDDRSTSQILDRFYGNLAEGMGRYEALREAQDHYLRNTRSDEERNPIYWAGLTMIGEDGPVHIARADRGEFKKMIAQTSAVALAAAILLYLYARWRKNRVRSSG